MRQSFCSSKQMASATTAILLFFLLGLTLKIQPCHGDAAFLTSQCQNTHNFNFCMQTMQTDNRSLAVKTTAEILGISIDISSGRTAAVVSYIAGLAKQNPPQSPLGKAMNNCVQIYNGALKNLGDARNYVGRELFMKAYHAVKSAREAPESCRAALGTLQSPVSQKNQSEKDLFGMVFDFAELMNGP